jgi:2-methylcitrate dehydratase PrpD
MGYGPPGRSWKVSYTREGDGLSLSHELAESSLREASELERERLRALSLGNLAAAAGDLGSAAPLVEFAGRRAQIPAERAAHLAMAFHARTQDDFYPAGRMHVGAISLAVALALADEVGERLFDCLTCGYEVICRTSAAYAADAQARGLRPSGMFGPLGAAATASAAVGLDAAATANAIGLAATMSAGTNQAWISGTDEWLLEVGAAASAGVRAVELTVAGARASSEALEGRAGWARAYFDDAGAGRLAASVEREDPGLAEVAAKPYPVSGIAQVPTWLACEARPLVGAGIERVRCEVSESELAYPGSANRGPFAARSDALMSIAFCVGCGLADGVVGLARLEAPNEAELSALTARVEVAGAADLEDGEARLECLLADGETIRSRASAAEVLFPAWEALDSAALASRSEAPEPLVAALREALAAPNPSAPALARELQLQSAGSLPSPA